jgi:F-type H+-transporting ATPase subunit a
MAGIIILLSQVVMIRTNGMLGYFKHFFFNSVGESGVEKGINIFVGWLHFIGEISKLLSLSLRLFGNIIAGIILISIITYLTTKLSIFGIHIGEFAVLPFWFFELFVAFIQALVFLLLSATYIRDAGAHEEH